MLSWVELSWVSSAWVIILLYTYNSVVGILEQLSGGGSAGGSDDEERKVFYELGCSHPSSCYGECGSAAAASGGGHLTTTPSFELLPPPPYDTLGSYPLMSHTAASFIHPNVVPTGNMQSMNANHVHQQQQHQHLTLSPFNSGSHGLYGTAGAHLVAEPPPPVLPAASSYSETMAPSIRNVSNGYWYPPGTDSMFSSKLLARRNNILVICVRKIKVVVQRTCICKTMIGF